MAVEMYVALVSANDGGFSARFPDVPELGASAGDLVSLLNRAREALDRELQRREAAGEDWPTPMPVGDVQTLAAAGTETLMLVDVQVEDRPIRVNISIGERLLKRLDEVAASRDMSRSGYIAACVRRSLGADPSEASGNADARSQRLFDEVTNVGRRVNEALGPDSTIGKALADLDARALDGLRALSTMVGGKGRSKEADPARPEPEAAPGTRGPVGNTEV